jgi:hypothetical protein
MEFLDEEGKTMKQNEEENHHFEYFSNFHNIIEQFLIQI